MVGLGDLPGGSTNSHAYGVSANGTVIVGEASAASGGEAFRWTQEEGMVGLDDLAGGSFSSSAYDISADGAVIVGHASSASGTEAFIWDATQGMRSLREVLVNDFGLGASLAGWTLTSANDISGDGQFIVGSGINPSGNPEAWLARIEPQSTLLGDFNNDGAIDAADYVVWRKTDGTPASYDAWRAHFGQTAGSGASAGANAAVPEPTALRMLVVAMIAYFIANSRPRHKLLRQ
jgi:probable HAF family extracellular repeat protein